MDKSKFNNKKEWRNFAVGLSIILSVIAVIQWYTDSNVYQYFALIAIIILFCGLTVPIIIKPLFIGFSYLGLVLGWVMTRIILIILFYLIFTLIGLVMRLFGKKLLDTTFDRKQKSYWKDRKQDEISSVNYNRQF